MSRTEQKRVQCAVASTAQTKRYFEQLFSPTQLPVLHFESVIHEKAIKWGVLLRDSVCLVPLTGGDDKNVVKIPLGQIKSMRLDQDDHFLFADDAVTKRSAKLTIKYVLEKRRKSRASKSPMRKIPLLGGRQKSQGSDMDSDNEQEEVSQIQKEENFYVFDDRTRLSQYLHIMWIEILTAQLYGWNKCEDLPEGRIKELYIDLQKEIGSAKSLQTRVDLVDELAHAVRFSLTLKKCVIYHPPSMVQWIMSELKKFTVDKWKNQPEMKGLGRPEALQYVLVLLELLNKSIFQCWSIFTGPEGKQDLETVLEPKNGMFSQLVQVLWLPYVQLEELQPEARDFQSSLEVMHTMMSVLYMLAVLFVEANDRTHQEHGQHSKKWNMYTHVLVSSEKHIEKRMDNLVTALKQVLLRMPEGPLRIITMYHYAYVLHNLCQHPSVISQTMIAAHGEDMHFLLPRFVLSREDLAERHPMEKKTSILLQKLLYIVYPDGAKAPRDEGEEYD